MYKYHFKQTARMAVPLVVGQIGQLAMSVVDNIMVGRVGAEALAAASIGNGLFTIVMVMGIGISMAMTPLTAVAHGRGEYARCGTVLRQGLMLNMACGLLLCLLAWAGAESIRFLNQPAEIVAPATLYMKVLGLSMLPIMLFQSFRQFAEGVSILRPAMVITLAANAVNFLTNWVFIYGNLGAPALGLTGAGIATFSSRFFMALAMMAVVMKSQKMAVFDPSLRFRKVDFPLMGRLLKIGIPGACQYFFEVSAFSASAVIVGWMGTVPLAAHQVAINLASISFMVAMGISAASTIRVGNAVGRESIPDIRAAGFSAIVLVVGFMSLAGLVFVLGRYALPALYLDDIEVIYTAGALLIIVAFFQISDGVQAVAIGMLRGIPDMKIPTLITLTAYWIMGLPSGYVLAFWCDLGIYGVWWGLLISLTVSALLMVMRFHFKTRMALDKARYS
ncbi:MAG: MATE family efflux transporter [Desulfobacterales bacterium]|nr:MATE family efflux transporter [Desulfobacterales bacterium]